MQAIVHDDEGGQPHLHFCFIPVEEDLKHEQGYKICANDVLDRRELRNFILTCNAIWTNTVWKMPML